MKARLASATVVMQGIVMLLALPVISSVSDGSSGNKNLVLIAAVIILLSPALFRRRGGYVIGHLAQAFALVVSIEVTPLLVLNLIFVGLWVMAIRGGGRIDRDRAEWQQSQG